MTIRYQGFIERWGIDGTDVTLSLFFVAIFSISFMKSVTTKGEVCGTNLRLGVSARTLNAVSIAGKRVCMPNSSTFCISLESGVLRILKKIMLADQLSWSKLSKRGSGIENSVPIL